ncbi:hypothetical protein BLNAU_13390 [Blattamonas nauphoetae]|uniref:Uncharacterized protein n=1 Tax=Blattamonas nauphoetae TaxID=2049346 RepID=A0ABQ9XGQ8_9EUKA|nr:hypothetical protein BLNAU_13390 [Blattamonas nauphoetae]
MTGLESKIITSTNSPSTGISSDCLSCSPKIILTLVKADLIHQLVSSLNAHSISFTKAVNIHTCLISHIPNFVWLATPTGLAELKLKDRNEQKAVRETVFQHVLAPSEKYIYTLCKNRYSIIDGGKSIEFLRLLTRLLGISPYYPPTMHFFRHIPVLLTIPSCLAFTSNELTIWNILFYLYNAEVEWSKPSKEERQMWKTVPQMVKMEGMDDVIEQHFLKGQNRHQDRQIIGYSLRWNNLQGMNLTRLTYRQTSTSVHFELFLASFWTTPFVCQHSRISHHLIISESDSNSPSLPPSPHTLLQLYFRTAPKLKLSIVAIPRSAAHKPQICF